MVRNGLHPHEWSDVFAHHERVTTQVLAHHQRRVGRHTDRLLEHIKDFLAVKPEEVVLVVVDPRERRQPAHRRALRDRACVSEAGTHLLVRNLQAFGNIGQVEVARWVRKQNGPVIDAVRALAFESEHARQRQRVRACWAQPCPIPRIRGRQSPIGYLVVLGGGIHRHGDAHEIRGR